MADQVLPTFEGDFIFAEDEPFALESGGRLRPVTLRYALYGQLNEDRGNAILVCHALSGSARVGDWWPQLFGGEGVFDPERDCIIGVNVPGSCYGSTGPRSIDPERGARYGVNFPLVTVRDWVRAQRALLRSLGVERLRAVIGGSIGGMQAVQWAIEHPDQMESCIAIGAAPLTAMGLALNHLQRQAILNDPDWQGGDYPDARPPAAGLRLARAIAMCSYKSADLFTERYGRNPNRNGEDPLRSLGDRYDIGGYLDYQGEVFTARFDASAYLMITRAMDTFDPARGHESEAAALARIRARVLLVGISSDWLFPAAEVEALGRRMRQAGARVEYAEIQTAHGHDGFLAEPRQLAPLMRRTLDPPAEAGAQAPLPHRPAPPVPPGSLI
ncbi:MAG: homoserine O-acetyltransferase [Blastocatellia bacterium]